MRTHKICCPECGAELTVLIEQEEETCPEAEEEKEQEGLTEEELDRTLLKKGTIYIVGLMVTVLVLFWFVNVLPYKFLVPATTVMASLFGLWSLWMLLK